MTHDDDFSTLVSFLHDELTSDEVDALVERLKSDPALAVQLLATAEDEIRIMEWVQLQRQQIPACLRRVVGHRPRATFELSRLAALAAAVVLFAVIGLALDHGQWRSTIPAAPPQKHATRDATRGDGSRDSSRTAIAKLQDLSKDCVFFVDNRVRSVDDDGRAVRPGDTVRLLEGQLDLLFQHGTRVSLRGPALFEVHNAMHTRMHQGSIRVDVAKGAEGFEVLTPVARVIDLGTQFGINVDNEGKTDVAVFKGSVDLEGGFDEFAQAPIVRRLVAGEAVQLDRRGTLSRIVTISDGQFPVSNEHQQYRTSATDAMLITEVWDNIERDESYKFYEIVRGGMREDAKAFVDRIYHEWNGVDESGMPEYLVGGDYVKTFNSDKMNANLRINLEVARPATVYVLLDNRVPVPSWLPQEFENTGDIIGIDEGFPDGGIFGDQTTSVGPGVSIDNTFSIWKRELKSPGRLRLGPIEEPAPGPNPSWINMYGIVAVPLDRSL